jgi:hypothetical protein
MFVINNIFFLILRIPQGVLAYPRGVRVPQVEYHWVSVPAHSYGMYCMFWEICKMDIAGGPLTYIP